MPSDLRSPSRPELSPLDPQRSTPAGSDQQAPRSDPEGPPSLDPRRFAAHVRARAAADEKLRAKQFRNDIRDRNRMLAWAAGIFALALALLLATLLH